VPRNAKGLQGVLRQEPEAWLNGAALGSSAALALGFSDQCNDGYSKAVAASWEHDKRDMKPPKPIRQQKHGVE
jgi:hypothetical protein